MPWSAVHGTQKSHSVLEFAFANPVFFRPQTIVSKTHIFPFSSHLRLRCRKRGAANDTQWSSGGVFCRIFGIRRQRSHANRFLTARSGCGSCRTANTCSRSNCASQVNTLVVSYRSRFVQFLVTRISTKVSLSLTHRTRLDPFLRARPS